MTVPLSFKTFLDSSHSYRPMLKCISMRLGEMTLPIPGRRRQTSTKVDPFVTTKLSLFPQNQDRPASIPCGILYSSRVEVEAVQLSL
jgi:hypothetical protein